MAKKQRSKGQGTLFKRDPKGPWIARWFTHDGKRAEQSTRTTDRAAAERILVRHVADAALRRDGVVDARKDRFAVEGRKPLAEHFAAYVTHCRHVGQDERHVDQKDAHLKRLAEKASITRLADLTADAVEGYLRTLKERGRSARSVNFVRQIAVAFMSWCVKTGKAESNPLKVIPKLDESEDRRRVRRPLTDDELARLVAVADERGRKLWYLTAALAGLRRGDLIALTWGDIDLDGRAITIGHGKAKRTDIIPMHTQLADELAALRDERQPEPTDRVFPTEVTNATRIRDFLRAGLAHRETVTDDKGEPVMIGKGKRRRPLTRIVCEDAEGRVVDLHALRTTLGTNLARQGVAVQLAQKIMRHASYKTTQKHYVVLGLTDTTGAIDCLPGIGKPEAVEAVAVAEGTNDTPCTPVPSDPRLYPRQLGRESARLSAATRGGGIPTGESPAARNSCDVKGSCGQARLGATIRENTAGVAQLAEHQPSKLNVDGSNPFARCWREDSAGCQLANRSARVLSENTKRHREGSKTASPDPVGQHPAGAARQCTLGCTSHQQRRLQRK
jgi:integrase